MSIVLTGDVHEKLRGAQDQRFTSRSEFGLAADYAPIAAQHGLKVTLFVTARAISTNTKLVNSLLETGNVEVGGHGWDALRPQWWHGGLNRLIGSPHGPAWLQRRMIRRTCTVIQNLTGQPVQSWRNHAYRHDPYTPRLLAAAGIKVWSDAVEPAMPGPAQHPDGVTVLPINTLPDHENLLHGTRTSGSTNAHSSYTPEKWCELVCSQVQTIVSRGGTATILAHPICMKICNDWETFDRLCQFLSGYTSLFAREVKI